MMNEVALDSKPFAIIPAPKERVYYLPMDRQGDEAKLRTMVLVWKEDVMSSHVRRDPPHTITRPNYTVEEDENGSDRAGSLTSANEFHDTGFQNLQPARVAEPSWQPWLLERSLDRVSVPFLESDLAENKQVEKPSTGSRVLAHSTS